MAIQSILKNPLITTGKKKTKKATKKKTRNYPRSNNKARKESPEIKLHKLPKAECIYPDVSFNLGYANIAFKSLNKLLDKRLLGLRRQEPTPTINSSASTSNVKQKQRLSRNSSSNTQQISCFFLCRHSPEWCNLSLTKRAPSEKNKAYQLCWLCCGLVISNRQSRIHKNPHLVDHQMFWKRWYPYNWA